MGSLDLKALTWAGNAIDLANISRTEQRVFSVAILSLCSHPF